jgi:hypothetical protein
MSAWSSFASVAILALSTASMAAGQPAQPRGQEASPITFKVLLIIKRSVDLHQAPFLEVHNRLTDEDVRAVKAACEEYTRYWVDKLTDGRVRWEGTVVISDLPLRSVNGDRTCAACGAMNYPEDIARWAPVGRYDGVFVYFKHIDDETGYTLPRAFGLSIGPNPDANHAGQSCVNWAPARLWTRDSETTEVFLHEWLHQLEAFYSDRGVKLPAGGLHGAERHAYKHDGGWKSWYRDFLNGAVAEGGQMTGLGPSAWAHGTLREAARHLPPPTKSPAPEISTAARNLSKPRLKPEYLTTARRRTNLLHNPSFEGDAGAWKGRSWRDNPTAASVVTEDAHSGPSCVRLTASDADDVQFVQRVSVEPYTNYLFSGWVRTRDVRIVETGGDCAAHLCVLTTGEQSHSVAGTSDWRYVVLMFYSRDENEVEVATRLGGNGSTVAGTAWFDDLCLIPLSADE